MAEPKKETVRIALPPRAAPKDAGQNGGAKDTARIVLPSRTPVIPPRRVPPAISPSTPAAEAVSESPVASLRRPPVAPPKPTVNMTKTQPLIMRPVGSGPASPITVVTSRPVHGLDLIPRSYCWGLLGISAFILLIQVWNYFSS